MCGLLGIASKNKIKDRDWLNSGRDILFHRGPDAFGSWSSPDERVTLLHRRLSIIDLNKKSNQPMVKNNSRYCVIFNGEIYNYRELRQKLKRFGKIFETNSDTEVLIEAYKYWGEDCLKYLNGMFAFAIYDNSKNKVFFARDRAGEKPLFFCNNQGQIIFASELKALLKFPKLEKKINHQSLDCYLSMGYIPKNLCILEKFNKLPPAHFMNFDLDTGKLEIKRYWNIPEYDQKYSMNEYELLNELEYLLEDSVKKQLMSDVPIGVLLSGGIDSSLITAFASKFKTKLKTFTVRMTGNKILDETEHARLIANYFQTDHIELEASEPNVDLLYELAASFDEPMADSSMIPTYLVSQLIKKHCTVALGGDGGDELFGGYGHYSRLLWIEKYLSIIPLFVRTKLSESVEKYLPMGFKGRNYISALKTNFENNLPLIASHFNKIDRVKLCPYIKNYDKSAEQIFIDNVPFNEDLLQRATRMDFENYLAEDILVKVDRASMANSLEIRAPMLDYRLIEFAFNKVPTKLKANISNKKILLKKLTEKILPNEFDRERKQGFSIPLNDWIKKGSFRDFFYDILISQNAIFEKKIVQELLASLDRGRSNSERLFALLMIQIWKNKYEVSI